MIKKALRRIAPVLIAAIMVFGLATVAHAAVAPPENDATVTGNTVTIGKTYKLANDGTVNPAETFYLVQTGKMVSDSSLTNQTMPDLVEITDEGYTGNGRLVGKVSFAEGEATAAGVLKNITIELPAYTAVGVYHYFLEEVDNGTPGVTYKKTPMSLVITVMNSSEGSYYVAGVHCEDDTSTGEKTDSFENVFSATGGTGSEGLRITKDVAGNLANMDKYFKFSLELEGPAGSYAPVKVKGGSHENNEQTVSLSGLGKDADADGSPDSVLVEFWLKNGETVTVANLPYGIGYCIKEDVDPSEGYVVAYDNDETAVQIKGTVSAGTIAHKVTNTKAGSADTGVMLDSIPYIVVLALVALAGAALVIFRIRRKAGR